MAMAIMRFDHKSGERRLCVASDGWAYDRPRNGRVWRYPHDGVQTLDSAAVKVDAESLGDVWGEVVEAWRRHAERLSVAADRAGY